MPTFFIREVGLAVVHDLSTLSTHALSLQYFLEVMKQNPALSIPGILEQTFKDVDCHLCEGSKTQHEKLKASAEARGSSAIPDDIYRGCGCTAVVAFLRIEDHNGQQSFLKDCNPGPSTNPPRFDNSNMAAPSNIFTRRRVLYCANAGDSHGVLCRGGKAIRLTYHHHTSNAEEVERINGAGGQIKKGYVQGHIMVTRSLGDYPDEGYVIGTPEQTQTELCDEDEFVILASDGVSYTLAQALAQLTHVSLSSQLWDVFEDQQAVEFIRDVKNPEEAATNLVNGALEKGTQDNVTVIVIRLKDFPVHVGEETTNLTWSISQHGSREGGPLWRRMFCCP